MYLIFDTETTGRPKNYNAPLSDSDNWPRLVQLAWQLHDTDGEVVDVQNFIVKPEGFEIPYATVKIHGITTERALKQGLPLHEVLQKFNEAVAKAHLVAGHNIDFDINIVGAEYYRIDCDKPLLDLPAVDTMKSTVDFCALPGGRGGGFKYPSLTELHLKLFGEDFDAAHNAAADVEATARCFLEALRRKIITAEQVRISSEEYQAFLDNNPEPVRAIGLHVQPFDPGEQFDNLNETPEQQSGSEAGSAPVQDFVHLHVHTQYSILDGLTPIKALADKALADNQKAVAISDHGNMFGVKEFHKVISSKGLKPILGMEAFMAYRSIEHRQQMDKNSYHLVLLAKNKTGYQNMMRLASIAGTQGFFYNPRIDRDTLKAHKEGLIALSACLEGEIPARIMNEGLEKGEEALRWYKEVFGDDFYIELQRHKAGDPEMNTERYEDQQYVNQQLLVLARKYEVKVVATNDVHFLNEEDYRAHDRLVCLNAGRDIDDPKRLRYTGQEWFKTKEEMAALFADLPDALATSVEIADKIENYELNHQPVMPQFDIPQGFDNEDDYLRHITYVGAKKRWKELSPDIKERLDFELDTIKKMGFPGYFLIVWDFLKAAREMGVIVGPGRGSAAGSAVAYCLRITDIDPIKYNLLFERFLNPERISMPDIDIDFDDEGREKILQWVKDKYGSRRVAHIITFGSMAAKSAIRDVARVQKMDLSTADRLAKMVPDKPGTTLSKAFKEVKELDDERKKGSEEIRSVLDYATKMEGAIRNTGTHACGIIIGKDDLDKYIPLNTVKNSTLDYATQYDGSHVENIGLLKMDFLGLKTLSIIKDALTNIKISQGEDIDINTISLEDEKTFELYSKGETLGLFQFESEGMRNHLRNLKPSRIDDLIAMNALYRPGPMDYIDDFIARKHGKQAIKYDLPEMEEYLAETYGITVYQEQVMLLSRKLAGFSRGKSDSLRKAMGKKIKHMMDELKQEFIDGGLANGHKKEILEKIWKDWEAFAKYAFNKSHATCYTYVSYQTAYLKAHYPSEFMASVLSHNFSDIKKLNFYLGECNRMNIKVLGPHINESYSGFMVNKKGEIRFGLAGIKGVGEAAVHEIINERDKNGPYSSIFDLVKRVNLRTVNKKTLESLCMVGAFDELGNAHRAQFFFQQEGDDSIFLEKIIKFGSKYQEKQNSNQTSLFGAMEEEYIQDPPMPQCEPWSHIKRLKMEKELLGFYLSGHPLDDYSDTLKTFAKPIAYINSLLNPQDNAGAKKYAGIQAFGGIVSEVRERTSKKGDSRYGIVTLEDKDASIDLFIFSETWLKYRHLFVVENFVFVEVSIGESRYRKGTMEARVQHVELLPEVMNKKASEIKLKLDINTLTQEDAADLITHIKSNKGFTRLKIYFYDQGAQLPMKYPGGVDAAAFLGYLKQKGTYDYLIS